MSPTEWETLSAIRTHNWEPSQRRNIDTFSTDIISLNKAELEAPFRAMILSLLHFRQMPDRSDNIRAAHAKTFEWLFEETSGSRNHNSWDSFSTWLREQGSSIYWVSGKPGSGKSTLMKFLCRHTSLPVLLKQWAPDNNLVKAMFYSWNSGDAIQMSRVGLLRALLHGCFSDDVSLLIPALPERWKEFCAFGRNQEAFSEAELHRIFGRVISDDSRQFFFLIDGLDEFAGNPAEIVEFVLGAARPNVKMCVASRPWLKFEDAFKQRPSLRLQDLTREDIAKYVSEHFDKNDYFVSLQNSIPIAASALLRGVVEKAHGVFLWVYLVVNSLLQGLLNSDRLEDLQSRLDALPGDLQALFDKLLNRLSPECFKQSCLTFRLLRTYYKISDRGPDHSSGAPTLLDLYFADDKDTRSSLQSQFRAIDPTVAKGHSEIMRRRLNARCEGFLETNGTEVHLGHGDRRVGYLHRTAREFIESDHYWSIVIKTSGHDSFRPENHWANALLWSLKSFPSDVADTATTTLCLRGAALIQARENAVQKTYLDDLIHGAYKHMCSRKGYSEGLLTYKLAVTQNHADSGGYVALTLAEADSESREHAMRDHVRGPVSANPVLQSTVSYYRTPRGFRCLRRRPALPRYE
jgi:hypothetical protein